VAVEACVDNSRQCFAVHRSRRFHGLLPSSDRVLRDRAGRQTFADRIRLSPTSIVPDDGNAFGCNFAYSVHNTNGRPFVGVEHASEFRIARQRCLGHFGRLQLNTCGVLDADHFDVRIFVCDVVQETIATADTCAAGLIVSHNGNGAGKKFSILSAASGAAATLSMVAVDIGIPASDAICSGLIGATFYKFPLQVASSCRDLTTQTHLNHS
jgi:hypothetical protein